MIPSTYDALMEVRTALTTTTNTTGGDTRSLGGNEIQKLIDEMITDALNRKTDIRELIPRKPLSQLAHIWNIRSDLGSTGKAAFYSDGSGGTPYPSTKIQLSAAAKAYRSDYEISGLMLAASSSYYDALEDESKDALDALRILEEKAIICGTDTSAYGFANSFPGLITLMNSYVTFADTTTIYGIARASGKTYLDVGLVGAGATATAALTRPILDSAKDTSDKAGADGNRRIWFCSVERASEIDQLLDTHQRVPSSNFEGAMGFNVTAYRNIPIIKSRFMDKNGVTYDGAVALSYADNAMYLLDLDNIEMRILNGVDFKHVPIMGADASQRSDVQGGYFKTYGTLVMKRFDTQVLIYNLATP